MKRRDEVVEVETPAEVEAAVSRYVREGYAVESRSALVTVVSRNKAQLSDRVLDVLMTVSTLGLYRMLSSRSERKLSKHEWYRETQEHWVTIRAAGVR